ncbi:MAG: GNAT family N-acetyltransferase [Alphaproteobacteria bacterium]
MPNMNIRAATISDIPGMLPLLEQLGYPASLHEAERRFKDFVSLKGYGVAVACISDKVIGWVAWSKTQVFISDNTRFHIEGLVVDEQHRGQGIGKQLMTFVEDYAKGFHPCIIDLTSGLRRAKDGSHEFYKALGYHNEGLMAKLYLRKELSVQQVAAQMS